jgi:ADP-sugar diphosphatase
MAHAHVTTSPSLASVVIHGASVPVTARPGIDLVRALDCVPFKDWCLTMESELKVHSIEVTDVDYFGPRVGFLKFKADVEYNGVRVPGIVFARGGAVAVLVIVRCEGRKWAICCKQPRVPSGRSAFLEIPAGESDFGRHPCPSALISTIARFVGNFIEAYSRWPLSSRAGMLDGSGHFAGVAAKELEEETGIIVTTDKLFDMTAAVYPGERGWYPSVGACDEFLRLMHFATDMTRAELEALRGKTTGEWRRVARVLQAELAGRFRSAVLHTMPREWRLDCRFDRTWRGNHT